MIACPTGSMAALFQKHWEQERPDFVQTITVFSAHKDEQHAYLLCTTCDSPVARAIRTLEFHVCIRAPSRPDTAARARLRELLAR